MYTEGRLGVCLRKIYESILNLMIGKKNRKGTNEISTIYIRIILLFYHLKIFMWNSVYYEFFYKYTQVSSTRNFFKAIWDPQFIYFPFVADSN